MRFENTNMPKERNKEFSFSNFGFSTILLTFVVLCIMTFGVLSLITANSDYKLSQKVADKAEGYYKAEQISYEYLTRIEDQLAAVYATSPTQDNYLAIALDYTDSKDSPWDVIEADAESTDPAPRFHWEVPVTDSQYLYVTVRMNTLEEIESSTNAKFYTIEEWYTGVHAEEGIIIDDTLNLMQ